MSNRTLIIAESPAKARTLSKMLPSNYIAKASFGHVSDLPKSKLGFDPDDNYKPEFSVTKDKSKIVRELKSLVKSCDVVILATDGDAEGHAISYHLYNILNLKNKNVHRAIFHEITKKAIMEAINNPVTMKTNQAFQAIARRILDRAVGYKLSPLLWKKIKFGLSAGRVQSVALRIIVDKEKEITKFEPKEFWKLRLNVLSKPEFKAELAKIDGKKAVVESEDKATFIKDQCNGSPYTLDEVIEKDATRNPPPPFTTSTLQQVASSKAGFGVKQTMMVAQKLYEGSISVPGHTGGLITYMRTDSVNLSEEAIRMAKDTIRTVYGNEYVNSFTRVYKTKSKGAQEAHEAIRPVNMKLKPDDLRMYLDNRELKLYTLIWARAMATQMSPAKVSNTTYKITGGKSKQYEFIAKGTKILFPGFLKAYGVGEDTEDGDNNDEKFLPNVPQGTVFNNTKLTAEQNFTKPPARYSEASLVKKLEAEGIGRPSTYASTISTIITREYVERNKEKKLQPTMIGEIVSDYLVENFPDIVDLKFTSNMEEKLDKVGNGEIKWQKIMEDFYPDFIKNIKSKEGGDRVQYSDARVVGVDEETGLDIQVRSGQYGGYVQIGESSKTEDGKKIKPHKTSPIPKGIKVEDVTLEDALHYLKVPRKLGELNGKFVSVGIGRFGPFIINNGKYYSLKPEDDVYSIELPRALEIIKEVDSERAKNLWCDFPKEKISIVNGRYGAYIIDLSGKKRANWKLPKGMEESEIKKLTIDKVKDIIKNQPVSTGKKKFKRKG